MNKTAFTEFHRLFVVDALPEPLTAASAHLQIFDTYIPETRLRVRQMRDPATNNWTRLLQQRFCISEAEYAVTKLVEMHLNDDEFAIFERTAGHETRKNRYFHEFDGQEVALDVYLGGLRGLILARTEFGSAESMREYEPAPFMILEVTEEAFFQSGSLASRQFVEVRDEISRIARSSPRPVPDE